MNQTLGTLMSEAMLAAGMDQDEIIARGYQLSRAFGEALARHGMGLHVTARCARLPASELGRPMTPDEMVMVGLTMVDQGLGEETRDGD